jgi:hypothetical protein
VRAGRPRFAHPQAGPGRSDAQPLPLVKVTSQVRGSVLPGDLAGPLPERRSLVPTDQPPQRPFEISRGKECIVVCRPRPGVDDGREEHAALQWLRHR